MSYTYDADGNRSTLQFPGYVFSYTYTGRNQLKNINFMDDGNTVATFGYDLDGNVTSRDLGGGGDGSTSTDYDYDELDRVTDVLHYPNGDNRTFAYGYDNVGNRKWTKRDGGTGDVFGYDLADQVTAVKLDIPNPDTTSVGPQTIFYDANGNWTLFKPYGPADTYALNNLNQYSNRNGNIAVYDANGNLKTGVDGSTYTYDAQNRLLSATNNGLTMSFAYDGLNRQVSRWLDWGRKTYSMWDGWDLVQEYEEDQGAGVITASYLHGPTGLVKELVTNNYYYQDGSGSTSHLADSDGALLEWDRYDLQGTPIFYDAADQQIPRSVYEVRHLFTGQQWYKELDLYDLRNRFYSPDIGRFLQPDPIGFWGDRTNLYRYCKNNPVTRSDPMGLEATANRVIVTGEYGEPLGDPKVGVVGGGALPFMSFGGSSGGLSYGELGAPYVFNYNPAPRPEDDQPNSPSTEQPAPSEVPPQNPEPPATSVTVAGGPGVGIYVTVTYDFYGQTFFSFGVQAGKSLPALPVSIAVTGQYIIGQKNPSASQIAKTMRGLSWSASGGYWAGGQLSGPATPQIFLPSLTGAGAGSPNSWGGGFVSPQIGVGVGYTWQLPTLPNPPLQYSPTYVPEGP